MSTESDELVPVFMPALGSMLIRAEDVKGSPLTQTEVLRLRDAAPCIMMAVADAQKLDESRGYRDIDPENCWHDWQNLRAELGRKPALPPGPRFNQVRDSDQEFQQAVRDAQSSLNHFRRLIAGCEESGAMPMIKTRIVEGDQSALMWLCNAREIDGGFTGELFELPGNFQNYHVGDWIDVPEASILDWMVNEHGVLFGGLSIRLIRSKKTETERAQYDEYIGVTSYAPVSAGGEK